MSTDIGFMLSAGVQQRLKRLKQKPHNLACNNYVLLTITRPLYVKWNAVNALEAGGSYDDVFVNSVALSTSIYSMLT